MNERERIAARLASRWTSGQCHYCLITDEHVDGDRIRWVGERRNVCSRSQCVRRFQEEVTRELGRIAMPRRKRTPAEIHELKMQELRDQRRLSRQRARARRRGAA